jgi:hypothetical protein
MGLYIYVSGYRYHQSYHQYDGILTIPGPFDGSPGLNRQERVIL